MPLKLIVGLGNPGRRYRDTRHNVGFAVVDELARRHDAGFEGAPADALMARARRLGPDGAILAKPLTMMNLSGFAVSELSRYFRVAPGDLLVVADDVALPLGRLRARPRGSDGGHKGFRSIIEQLGNGEFARLRVGVGRGDARRDLADHVLGGFDPEERPQIAEAIGRAADAAEVFVLEGIEAVMNRFNADPLAREDAPGATPER
ncbi:MAG TPA: aminoacyl-tRNA hydrolase [Vicinamibacterales bacterium]|nr:aminoacyl-tRNA hydrolase [Vicinamibacterales bacterium]